MSGQILISGLLAVWQDICDLKRASLYANPAKALFVGL
jgi:hypothetical protein